MRQGRAGTMTHDDKRNGTTTLFAALNALDGKVMGQRMKRHRHQELLRFLDRIGRQTLPYPDIHPIERFFAEITRKRIRRGAFKSRAELEAAIYDYLAKHNQNPVPPIKSTHYRHL